MKISLVRMLGCFTLLLSIITLTACPNSGSNTPSSANLKFSPNSASLSATPQNTASTQITVTNTGAGIAHNIAVVTSSLPNTITTNSNCSSNLATNSSCIITVTYAPTSADSGSFPLQVSYNDGTGSHTASGTTINYTATGSSTLSNTTNTPSFEITASGTKFVRLTLTNNSATTVSGLGFVGSHTGFSVYAPTTTCGSSLAANASCVLTLNYTAGSSVGVTTATVSYGTAANFTTRTFNVTVVAGFYQIPTGLAVSHHLVGDTNPPTADDITAIAVSGDYVYAGDSTASPPVFYYSTNGGNSFTASPATFAGTEFVAIVASGTTVYAADNANNLYKSTNGGQTFSSVTSYTGGNIRSLYLDPSDANNIYVGTQSSGIEYSTNGGTSFTDNTTNLGFPVTGIAKDSDGNFYVVQEDTGASPPDTLYKASSISSTFTDIGQLTNSFPISPTGLFIDPHNNIYVVSFGGTVNVCSTAGTCSAPTGTSGSAAYSNIVGNANEVFAGADEGLFETINQGVSFSIFQADKPGLPVTPASNAGFESGAFMNGSSFIGTVFDHINLDEVKGMYEYDLPS